MLPFFMAVRQDGELDFKNMKATKRSVIRKPVVHSPGAREIRDGIYWLHPRDGGEVFFVRTSAGLVMFDTSMPRHKNFFLREMRKVGLDPSEIVLGFITHLHCDHCGGMGWWSRKFKFPVVAHEQAVGPIAKGDLLATGAYMFYTGFDEDFVPCHVKYKVKGGEKFIVGDRCFEVFHAPGHTVGSIHILDGENLFVGDTLFENGGIGWMDVHWGSQPQDYVETLQLMHAHVGKMAYPGHGAPYRLKASMIRTAQKAAAFYIGGGHGLGSPRAPSQYASRKNVPSPNRNTILVAGKA